MASTGQIDERVRAPITLVVEQLAKSLGGNGAAEMEALAALRRFATWER